MNWVDVATNVIPTGLAALGGAWAAFFFASLQEKRRQKDNHSWRMVPPYENNPNGSYMSALDLSAELEATLQPLLALWAQLTEQLAEIDAALVANAAANPVVQRLTTAPGVGPVIATAVVATLDEAGRFRGAHQVESYLGLVPSEDSSADRHRRRHITKAGNPRMRWLLVQAAWAALRSRRADAADLRAWAHRLAQRRGSRIATVALARRLAGILFAMWRDQSTFVGRHGPVAVSASSGRPN